MRFLVCGLGSIGARHLEILKTLGNHEVCSYSTGKATISLNIQPDKVFFDLDSALIERFDAALVTNPTALHIPVALEIARQGIPLFIEKPVSHSLDGIDELLLLCKDKIPVLIGTNMIYHPAIRKMKQLLQEEAIGRIICVRAQFGTYLPDWHPWEDYRKSYASLPDMGGGVVRTSIHELCYLTDFFGDVDEVQAMEIKRDVLDIEAEEGCEILLRHSNGIVSNIHLNFFQRPPNRYCEIIGTKGSLYWYFWSRDLEVRKENGVTFIRLGTGPLELLNESFELQMKHFLAVIKREAIPQSDLEKGVADLQIAIRILEGINR
ncbi:Gfo/Idh/MocA family protein [Thermodesulfobacteriota bacterium]